MNKPTWREKFDEKFCDENGYVITGELSTTKLKHFIQSELSQQRKEIVVDLESMKEDAKTTKQFIQKSRYNEAIDDIITKLSSEEV